MDENKVYTAIGLMSGTSLDGIDIALVETNGIDHTKLLNFQSTTYDESLKSSVRKVFNRREVDEDTREAERLITQAHIEAVNNSGFKADLIGFHGQTISHDPAQRFTWQIGDSAQLAAATGIDVIGDMRQADVQAGGQGAPLLPLCHRSFARAVNKPTVILNIGGVSNITWLGREEDEILAFDTGPGNALIDDLVKARTGATYDEDGALAKAGTPNEDVLTTWLSHPYFEKAEPKSLDRNAWDVAAVEDLPLEDAVATVTEFTVRSIVKALSMVPETPKSLYVAGGGRHNQHIMTQLQKELSYPVRSADELGWNGDALEAQGWAYLAVRSLLGLPLSVPTTTGVEKPMTGGKLFKAPNNV